MFVASLTLLACGESASDSDDCVDTECTTPPAPSCQNGLAIIYESVGSCVSNRCAYEATTTPCSGACAGNVCDGSGRVPGDGTDDLDGSGNGSGDGAEQ